MAFLYGRAGRLTAKNAGFRPGQMAALGVAGAAAGGPGVALVGEHTNGAYSDMRAHALDGSGGWVSYLSTQRYTTAAGVCPEAVGTPPSLSVVPALDLAGLRAVPEGGSTGTDAALDAALAWIGAQAPLLPPPSARCPGYTWSQVQLVSASGACMAASWLAAAGSAAMLRMQMAPDPGRCCRCGAALHRARGALAALLALGAMLTVAAELWQPARRALLLAALLLLLPVQLYAHLFGHFPLGQLAEHRVWRVLNNPFCVALLAWVAAASTVVALGALVSTLLDAVDGVAAAGGAAMQLAIAATLAVNAAACASDCAHLYPNRVLPPATEGEGEDEGGNANGSRVSERASARLRRGHFVILSPLFSFVCRIPTFTINFSE